VLSPQIAPKTGSPLQPLVATTAKPIGSLKGAEPSKIDVCVAPADSVQREQPRPIELCALDRVAPHAQRKIELMSAHSLARGQARTAAAGKPRKGRQPAPVRDALPQCRVAQEACDGLDGQAAIMPVKLRWRELRAGEDVDVQLAGGTMRHVQLSRAKRGFASIASRTNQPPKIRGRCKVWSAACRRHGQPERPIEL
jgi:hypothetical protein